MKFGDFVKAEIDDREGTDFGWIIGEPHDSDGDVVMIASEGTLGMPINVHWLTIVGEPDNERAVDLRRRYSSEYPDSLKPPTAQTGPETEE